MLRGASSSSALQQYTVKGTILMTTGEPHVRTNSHKEEDYGRHRGGEHVQRDYGGIDYPA